MTSDCSKEPFDDAFWDGVEERALRMARLPWPSWEELILDTSDHDAHEASLLASAYAPRSDRDTQTVKTEKIHHTRGRISPVPQGPESREVAYRRRRFPRAWARGRRSTPFVVAMKVAVVLMSSLTSASVAGHLNRSVALLPPRGVEAIVRDSRQGLPILYVKAEQPVAKRNGLRQTYGYVLGDGARGRRELIWFGHPTPVERQTRRQIGAVSSTRTSRASVAFVPNLGYSKRAHLYRYGQRTYRYDQRTLDPDAATNLVDWKPADLYLRITDDFDGDGYTDIYWYREEPGLTNLLAPEPTRVRSLRLRILLRDDFNGDGRTEIFSYTGPRTSSEERYVFGSAP